VWKQFRESGPIALVGLAGIFAITVLVWLIEGRSFDAILTARALLGVTSTVGFLVTLVVGIGSFLFDADAKLNTFWRSRPIDANLWFWTKYVTGLAILVAMFAVPMAYAVWVKWRYGLDPMNGELFMAASIMLAIYSAAVLTTCLVRQALYAAVLSIMVMYLGVVPLDMFRDHHPTDEQVCATLLTTALVATLIAWQSVRRDWGWRSA
jgi:hypothetical protein